MSAYYFGIILVSGYIFVNTDFLKHIIYKRISGWESYFHQASWGVLFFSISCLIYGFILFWLFHHDSRQASQLNTIVSDIKYIKNFTCTNNFIDVICTGILSMFISFAYPTITNQFINKDKSWLIDKIKDLPNITAMETLLFEAIDEENMVKITLDHGKVYIGFPMLPDVINGNLRYIEILPLSSGYRDKETLKMTLTTSYFDTYEKLEKEKNGFRLSNFITIIPADRVVDVSRFDFKIYKLFHSSTQE